MHHNPYHDTRIITNIRFVTPLCLERSVQEAMEWSNTMGSDMYALSKDFKVCFTINNPDDNEAEYMDEECIVVPAGFLTDMASVPRAGRMVISRIGRHSEAAVIHDYLYAAHELLADSQYDYHLTDKRKRDKAYRAFADHMFLEIMRYMSTRPVSRTLAYWAVRMFGRSSWKKKRPYNFRQSA